MKATLPWLAAALAAALAAPAAQAQYYGPCPPQAPDCCGPCFYAQNNYGAWYGPNYNLYPGFGPFNGMVFAGSGGAGGPGGSPGFPTHPYARSPRDFFMVGTENPYALTAVYPPLTPSQPQYVAPAPPFAPPPQPPVTAPPGPLPTPPPPH